jgi:5'-3' exonuclease|tara:strand:- start:369 stop:1067 length:699 start_codon:yes stop_codon:yes gene_type:complete
MNNATALIDGDILVYRVGFSTNEPDEEKFAISRMGNFVDRLIRLEGIETYEGYLTGKNNYRSEIATEQTYKGNRKDARKPVHYDSLREYLVSKWGFTVIDGQEADDAMGIKAYDLPEDSSCIMTIDKDLDMIRGWHYNFVKEDLYYVTEKEAIKNFYIQILTGDRVDNIPGIKGIGPVKANKILENCTTEKSLFKAVSEKYDHDIDKLTERGRLLWIRRKEKQLWKPPNTSR